MILSVALVGCDDDGLTVPDSGPQMDAGPPLMDSGPGSTCDDEERNGDETSIDCGGSCDPCPDGENCAVAEDCESLVCDRGRCLVPNCMDGQRNGEESGTDCGGDCGLCPGGEPCSSNDECLSDRCRGGMCTPSSCEDGTRNADETDIDCGGPLCPACIGGLDCETGTDCLSLICSMDVCTDAACNDGVQNQDETSVDCGGSFCPGCREGLACNIDADCLSNRCFDGGCVSCMDRIRNAEETDIDCGGGVICAPCDDGQMCMVDADCTSGSCVAGVCESCVDGVMNQDETDVDCGGSLCPGCPAGDTCLGDGDCANGSCEPASMTCINCMDFIQNQDETDIDCGGTVCAPCAPGLRCLGNSDCASMLCDGPSGLCNAPGCGDGIQNGAETDLDCGGGSCIGCADGLTCVLGRDCLNGVCMGGLCQPPTCTDGVANGLETDIDCGGPSACPRCPDGRRCPNGPSDCVSPLCTSGRCGDVRGHLVLIGHDYFAGPASQELVLSNAVQLTPETGIIDVLTYDEWADITPTGEASRAEGIITTRLTAAGRMVRFTRLSSYMNLSTALTPAIDVVYLPEQERGFSAPWPTIAASMAPTLNSFLRGGGVVITSNAFDNGWQAVNHPMLITITGMGGAGLLSVLPAAASNPIAAGVMPYSGGSATGSYMGVAAGSAIMVTPIIGDATGQIAVYDALF